MQSGKALTPSRISSFSLRQSDGMTASSSPNKLKTYSSDFESFMSSTFSNNRIFCSGSIRRSIGEENLSESNYKRRIFILLHWPYDFDCLYHLTLLIIIVVSCVMLNVRQTPQATIAIVGNDNNIPRYPMNRIKAIHKAMLFADVLLGIILLFEMIVRLLTAGFLAKYEGGRGKLLYLSDYFHQRLLDSLGIVTCFGYFILYIILSSNDYKFSIIDTVFRIAHLIQLLQVYRIFGKLSSNIKETIIGQQSQLMLAFLIILTALIVCSFLLYLIEGSKEEIKNMADSCWLSFVTFSTIGYGDFHPATGGGRLFLCISALVGVIFFQLPSSIIGNGLAYTIREHRRLSYRYFETAKLIQTALTHHQQGVLSNAKLNYRPAQLLTTQIANELRRGKTAIKVNRCRTKLNFRGLKSHIDGLVLDDSIENLWSKLLHIQEMNEEPVSDGKAPDDSELDMLAKPKSNLAMPEHLLRRYTALDMKNPTSDNQMLIYCFNLIEDGVADITESVEGELAELLDEIESLLVKNRSIPDCKNLPRRLSSKESLKLEKTKVKHLSRKESKKIIKN